MFSIGRLKLGAVFLLLITYPIYSQESLNTPHIGLSVSLQSSQFDFLVPIWIGSKVTISTALGITWIQDAGTDIHIGLVPKFYLSRDKVSPFINFRVGFLRVIPSNGKEVTDWLLGASVGGEYFFDNNFSFGIESQLNYTISDKNSARFGNPGKSNFNTAAAILQQFIFNCLANQALNLT